MIKESNLYDTPEKKKAYVEMIIKKVGEPSLHRLKASMDTLLADAGMEMGIEVNWIYNIDTKVKE